MCGSMYTCVQHVHTLECVSVCIGEYVCVQSVHTGVGLLECVPRCGCVYWCPVVHLGVNT